MQVLKCTDKLDALTLKLELSALWGTGVCSIDLLGAFSGVGCEER